MRSTFLLIVLIIFISVSNAFAQNDSVNIDLQKEKDAAEQLLSSGVTFRINNQADGRTPSGGTSSETGYEFSDGVYLSSLSADYLTLNNARAQYDDFLKHAVKVLARSEIRSHKDQSLTGGVVLVVLGSAQKRRYARISWFVNFIVLNSSSSLKHLLAYEVKREKEASTLPPPKLR